MDHHVIDVYCNELGELMLVYESVFKDYWFIQIVPDKWYRTHKPKGWVKIGVL